MWHKGWCPQKCMGIFHGTRWAPTTGHKWVGEITPMTYDWIASERSLEMPPILRGLPSRSLTQPLKNDGWKTTFLLGW